MDFLVTFGYPPCPDLVAIGAGTVESPAGRPVQHWQGGEIHLYASSMGLASTASRRFIFDGSLAIAGRLYHPLLDQRSATPPAHVIEDYLELRTHALPDGGVFCVGVITPDRVRIAVDPLSQYPMYVLDEGHRWMASNCIPMLAAVSKQCGSALTPSLEACMGNMLLGSPIGDDAPYAELRRLTYGAAIDARERLTLVDFRFDPDAALDYDASLDGLSISTHRHIAAVASTVAHPRHLVVDITGGVDSRTVLSFLLTSSLAPAVRGRCITRAPHPDGVIAERIMDAFRIDVAHMPVYDVADPAFVRELIVRESAALFGGSRDTASPVATVGYANLVHFKGSFGEIAGHIPGSASLSAYLDSGEWTLDGLIDLWVRRRRDIGYACLMTEGAIAHVRRSLRVHLQDLLDEGVDPTQLLPESYLRTRARHHFGSQSWIENKSRIVPDLLTTPWVHWARRVTPPYLIRHGKALYDTTMRNSPQLVSMPLAGHTWPPELVSSSRIQPPEDLEGPPPASSRGRPLMLGVRVERRRDHLTYLLSTASDAERSRKSVGGAIADSQALMARLLDAASPRSDIWDWLDRPSIIREIGKNPERITLVPGSSLGRAAVGLVHMLQLGITSQVQRRDVFMA